MAKASVVWTVNSMRTRIDPMKAVYVCIIAAGAWLAVMLGSDVWVHDQTLPEALKGAPQQMLASLGALVTMAWQYKLAAVLVFAVVATIIYLRRVPVVKSR
jgi:hypothetical protein